MFKKTLFFVFLLVQNVFSSDNRNATYSDTSFTASLSFSSRDSGSSEPRNILGMNNLNDSGSVHTSRDHEYFSSQEECVSCKSFECLCKDIKEGRACLVGRNKNIVIRYLDPVVLAVIVDLERNRIEIELKKLQEQFSVVPKNRQNNNNNGLRVQRICPSYKDTLRYIEHQNNQKQLHTWTNIFCKNINRQNDQAAAVGTAALENGSYQNEAKNNNSAVTSTFKK